MKSASIQEIKKEIINLNKTDLAALCIHLAKYKKENKELLNFLLFESHDIDGYIQSAIEEIDELFLTINLSHVYFAKKTLRKILRITNKYIKYSGNKQVEVELLIHYCTKFKALGFHKMKSQALNNLLEAQIKKIYNAIESLHEDLQFEYLRDVEML